MAEAENPNRREWKKRETFGSALAQIGVVAVLLAATVWIIYQRGVKREETAKRVKDTRALALRDNPADLDKALTEVEGLFEVDAKSAEGFALAADLHAEKWLIHRVPGEEKKARELLDQAKALNARAPERFATEALVLIADGKAKEADTFVDGLRRQGHSDARLWYAQARATHELGQLAAARVAYDKAAEKSWKDPRFSTAYGELLLDEGQYALAIEWFTKALGTNSNPDHLRARLDLALANVYRKDRVKDAADIMTDTLSRTAELTPFIKGRALAIQSELQAFESKFDDAVKAADEAIAASPDDHLSHFAKAKALALKKDPGALDAFQTAISKRKTAPILYFEGALLSQAQGNHAGAVALLDAYETTFKDVRNVSSEGETPYLERDDRYWITRGDVFRESQEYDKAMAAYDKAIAAKNVNLVKAHYAKGSLFLARKEFDKAAESLKDITPPDGTGSLAEAYLAMGELLFAKKDFAPGCQNFGYALAGFKRQQAPREKLNSILEDVNKRLIAAGQKPMAKLWMDEAKVIIQ